MSCESLGRCIWNKKKTTLTSATCAQQQCFLSGLSSVCVRQNVIVYRSFGLLLPRARPERIRCCVFSILVSMQTVGTSSA